MSGYRLDLVNDQGLELIVGDLPAEDATSTATFPSMRR